VRSRDPAYLKLEADIEATSNQIDDLNRRIRAMERQRDTMLRKLDVGDIVEYRKANAVMGRMAPDIVSRGVITKVGGPWPEMQVFTKDGQLSELTEILYRALRDDDALTILSKKAL
jgi:hypothetical protein